MRRLRDEPPRSKSPPPALARSAPSYEARYADMERAAMNRMSSIRQLYYQLPASRKRKIRNAAFEWLFEQLAKDVDVNNKISVGSLGTNPIAAAATAESASSTAAPSSTSASSTAGLDNLYLPLIVVDDD